MVVPPVLCQRCVRSLSRASKRLLTRRPPSWRYSTKAGDEGGAALESKSNHQKGEKEDQAALPNQPGGALQRRLQELTEDALLTGGRAGRRAVEEAGFSEELKNRLYEKVRNSQLRSGPASTSSFSVPASAGAGTRHMAEAQPWTGEEATADTVLRMLNDAHKPLAPGLRGRPKIPVPSAAGVAPVVVDMRPQRRGGPQSAAARAAAAREAAAAYTDLGLGAKANDAKDGKGAKGSKGTHDANKKDAADADRDARRLELRERLGPGARSMPHSISGLAALANERIEDAIARGQFRNIPRGPGVGDGDSASRSNPFVDTTEYFMNRMIQRQDMAPPWIEKQQELSRAAQAFRSRLRTDWRRHAVQLLVSGGGGGGGLEQQLARAADFAAAEQAVNPRRRDTEKMSVAAAATHDAVMKTTTTTMTAKDTQPEEKSQRVPGRLLRDPHWEATHHSYLEKAVAHLNALTRSYNLMAPDLAKKPYFSLRRELEACFADVAPTLAAALRERALGPPPSNANSGTGPRMLGRLLGHSTTTPIHDSRTANYGLKDMWQDFWGGRGGGKKA